MKTTPGGLGLRGKLMFNTKTWRIGLFVVGHKLYSVNALLESKQGISQHIKCIYPSIHVYSQKVDTM